VSSYQTGVAVRNVTVGYGSTRVSRAFVEFLQAEAAGGIIMMGAAAVALVVANTALAGTYDTFWHQYAGLSFGGWELELSLHHWVNDGLMAVFFFLVGLEIKRELLFGELASPRRAALPLSGAPPCRRSCTLPSTRAASTRTAGACRWRPTSRSP
jgi:hypothetical protein